MCGITRVANITGLDRIGIPVVAVMRPNSRSYAVAQGKGITLEAAKASGVMESIENYHAEDASLPLRLGRFSEVRRRFQVADVTGLPRLTSSTYSEHRPLLWAEGAVELLSGAPMLVPWELVHLDFRLPLPQGAGCFLMSSNGLASGNHILEAMCHALSELIERDANTLFAHASEEVKSARRIDLASVDDAACRMLLDRFDSADVDVIAWNVTSDIGVPSVLCSVVDRDPEVRRPMPAISGSGCHPRRAVALSRALTEAAQGRLTRIAGSRDDLGARVLDEQRARAMAAATRRLLEGSGETAFSSLPNAEYETFDEDVRWICSKLHAAGLTQVLAVNLTRPDFDIPVVKMVVPHLEAMSEARECVRGKRAQHVAELQP